MKDIIGLIRDFFNLHPSKRIRFFLYLLQVTFTVFISSELYKYFVGTYKVISPLNTEEFINKFLLTGNVFICLFFFIATWYISYSFGFDLLTTINKIFMKIGYWIVRFIARRMMKITTKEFESKKEGFLHRFISKKRKNQNMIYLGNQMKKVSAEKKYYMVYLILSMFLQFTIIYFILFDGTLIKSSFLKYLIVSFVTFYFISFMAGIFIIEFIRKAGDKISDILQREELNEDDPQKELIGAS